VALPLALFALVMLSGLLLAFLSMAGMEPTVASNHTDVTRARYAAEAGIEWAFDQLTMVNTNWNTELGLPKNGQLANGLAIVPGSPQLGTFTVQVRNDILAGDTALTGQPLDPSASAISDQNAIVILTATGTYQGVTRQIQAVVQNLGLPPIPGAYSMPGVQADLWFDNANFEIDGNDWYCQSNCNDPDPANRVYALKADQSKRKYGIAVQPGNQANMSPAQTYEQRAEGRLDTGGKRNKVKGKDQTNPGASTTGLNTVAADNSLDPAIMQTFLDRIAKYSGTKILQSTMSCPMKLEGDQFNPSKPLLSNGCGIDKQPLDLGDRQNPKLVYFRGELDPTSSFSSLMIEGKPIRGAGILIVEDGDLRVKDNFNWDGIIIITGRYVSSIFESGATGTIHGAVISNETIWNEGGNQNDGTYTGTYWDGYFVGMPKIRFSQEAIDIAGKALGSRRLYSWREI
jgi:hypothetical protein